MSQPVRRERNRKAQLVGIAADLFRERGYHSVGVNDIAGAAGISGPAVYRHFRSKQEILTHVVLGCLDAVGSAVDSALESPDGESRLHAVNAALAKLAVDKREVAALWRTQGRHLDPADQARTRAHWAQPLGRWVAEVRRVRPSLGAADAELLCWAALSVFGSVAVHRASLPKARFERLLADCADVVLRTDLPVADGEPAAEVAQAGPGASRREQLMRIAIPLFRERGYHAVSMEEIGSAAGITGPSIYKHFLGKADILLAASRRMADRLSVDASHALDAGSPAEALERLLRSYVDVATTSSDLLTVYGTELRSLPEQDRAELVQLQRAYVGQWVQLMLAVAPELAEAEARIGVHAALTIINDLVQMRRFAARPARSAEITAFASAVLEQVRL